MDRRAIKARAKSVFTASYWPCVGLFAVLGMIVGGASSLSSSGSSMTNLMNNYKDSIPSSVIAAIGAVMVILSLVGVAYAIFVAGPMSVSRARAGLNVYDGAKPNFKDIIYCFKDGRYMKCVGTMALQMLFVALAAMVVIIPAGIVAAIAAVGLERARVFGYGGFGIALALILVTAAISIPCIIVSLGLSQTEYIVAEEGLYGMAAIRRSWDLMRGRKGEFFVFGLSFIGWILLTAVTFGIVGIFYASPYMSISMAGYYRELVGGRAETVVEA